MSTFRLSFERLSLSADYEVQHSRAVVYAVTDCIRHGLIGHTPNHLLHEAHLLSVYWNCCPIPSSIRIYAENSNLVVISYKITTSIRIFTKNSNAEGIPSFKSWNRIFQVSRNVKFLQVSEFPSKFRHKSRKFFPEDSSLSLNGEGLLSISI